MLGALVALRRPQCHDGQESLPTAFAAQGVGHRSVRGDRAALRAYAPILRRDPKENSGIDRFARQSTRLWKRQRDLPEDEKMEKKKEDYLRKLGLASKIVDRKSIPPWHLDHVAAGDVFEGYFAHPDILRAERIDFTFTANSLTGGGVSAEKVGMEADVTLRQDFPIAFGAGTEARNRDMAAYIFSKFNKQWRSFDQPYPTDEDVSYLQLGGLRMFFNQIAQAVDYPPEEEFNQNCADPAKGMTLDEFMTYVLSEDPEYLEVSWEAVYTGRRIRFESESGDELLFDGDFSGDCPGAIFGFMTYNGVPGGTFEMNLKKG